MRLTNLRGRLTVDIDGTAHDVNTISRGRFSPDPQAIYTHWQEFRDTIADMAARAAAGDTASRAVPAGPLGPVVTAPRQIFAIGLNYADHAEESGFRAPTDPLVFTKFASCLAGPFGVVVLPDGEVDWEVELVIVIGRAASAVPEEQAWGHVAGVTAGQDLSERIGQFRGSPPQFGLAKSHPGFGPLGPALVTPDELADPDDIELGCSVNGLEVQRGRTSDMLFSVPELVARLSRTVTLLPGDLIFTGTPSGVGMGRTPRCHLRPGDQLESFVEGVGTMRQTFVAGPVQDREPAVDAGPAPEAPLARPATSGAPLTTAKSLGVESS